MENEEKKDFDEKKKAKDSPLSDVNKALSNATTSRGDQLVRRQSRQLAESELVEIDQIKQAHARLIDQVQAIADRSKDGDVKRWCAMSITFLEQSVEKAVKAIAA